MENINIGVQGNITVQSDCDPKVKIYAYKGDYAQIGFENIEKLIKYSKLTWDDSKKRYTINADALAEINANSEYKYTETDELKFAGYRDKDGNKVSQTNATHRNTLIENSRAGQKYWIKSDVVPSLDVLQPMQAMQPIGASGIQTGVQGTTAQATSPDNTSVESNNFEPCWVKLTADVDVIYDTEPNDQNTADISINAIMQVQRKIATATDNNGDKWYKIKGQYFEDDIKKSVEGWIKEKELTVTNPYNWNEFNWQLKEDTGNQYIYQFNANEGETPHDFIKTIWNEVDTNGDKVLTLFELQNAMRSEEKVNILSKLICKHRSEWDTLKNIDTFESEVKALYQKGIEQEDYPEEKQQLEQARDERISQLKEKIEKLCFWGDVQDGDVRELEEDEPSRTFPSDSNVYHFHPIAFVEQMKRIVGLEDIDLRPIIKWQTQFSSIFGSKKEQKKACYRASVVVLKNGGIINGGKTGAYKKEKNEYGFVVPENIIQTAVEYNKKIIVLENGAKTAIKYLDQELEKGNPILVGVRHSFFIEGVDSHGEWNYDKSTDHFIVIIGRGYERGQRFFRFYEVGTSYEDKGTHDENKLMVNDDWSITGNPQHKKERTYTLTIVLPIRWTEMMTC